MFPLKPVLPVKFPPGVEGVKITLLAFLQYVAAKVVNVALGAAFIVVVCVVVVVQPFTVIV